MDVDIEVLTEVTDEVAEAFGRLVPQLSSSAGPVDARALATVAAAQACTVLVARSAGTIVGTLTLAVFPIPTGRRAWIEDVVVDEPARGQGVAEALIRAALQHAARAGAKTVDLTSRPSRQAAGRLYERTGFEVRESRLYRYQLS